MRTYQIPIILALLFFATKSCLYATPSLKHTLPKILHNLEDKKAITVQLPDTQRTDTKGNNSFVVFGGVNIKNESTKFQYLSNNIFSDLIGKKVSIKTILDKAHILEQEYIKLGYFLTRTIVPPQVIENNKKVELILINGYIEQINIDKIPNNLKDQIQQILEPILHKQYTNINHLERCLKIAMNIPGLQLKSTLGRGISTGGVILFLEANHQEHNLILNYDNKLSKIQGGDQIVSSIQINTAVSHGEKIYISYGFDPTSSFYVTAGKRYLISSGINILLNKYGTNLFTELTKTISRQYNDELKIVNSFNNYNMGLSHPLILKLNKELFISSSCNIVNEEQKGSIRNLSKIRMVNIILKGMYKSEKYRMLNNISIKITQGLKTLGAKIIRPSRQGAKLNFTKIETEYTLYKRFGENNSLKINCNAQKSLSGPMFGSEQLNITSTEYFSGYYTGSISADEGYAIRVELAKKIQIPNYIYLNHNITPYIFGVYGKILLKQPTALEFKNEFLFSAGLGAKYQFSLYNTQGTVNVEYAWNKKNHHFNDDNRKQLLSIGISIQK